MGGLMNTPNPDVLYGNQEPCGKISKFYSFEEQ